MINIKNYSINNITLTNEMLVTYINNFWIDIFTDIKDTTHLMLMCKVQFTDENMGYRTLGHLRKVNFSDKDLFINYLTERLGLLNESYTVHPIYQITFSYIIKEGLCSDNNRRLLKDLTNKKLPFHNFNNLNLPISMNPSDYGDVRIDNYVQIDGELVHRFTVTNGNKIFEIDVCNNGLTNRVTILGAIDLSWVDTKINEGNSDFFKREIRKSTIYFMDGEVVLRKQILVAKAFKNLKVDNKLVNDFYTMDIETISVDRKLTPYLICAYNGVDYITSYGRDQKSLFSSFFNQLLSKIKPGSSSIVYAHNLSGFDGIFILRNVLSYGKVDPLIFNGKLMSIKVKVIGENKSENKTIIFKDSYLLLPLSLRKLCIAFGISMGKGYFPFKLTNIFYTGVLPSIEHWTGISTSIYNSLVSENKHKMWSFQQESIKYCKLDCQCLYEVLIKFNELIFNNFKVNIHIPLTLPALAMRIFKTHYMPKDSIYQILGKPDWNIRESYTGGAVDVYIPHNRVTTLFSKIKAIFITLFYYDVNSLYPSVMVNMDMPIGKPTAFEGNIRDIEPDSYGFFYCKITSPEYLEHPILQRRIKTSEGLRTIAGLGTWEGWIYSGEMDNAIKYGYTFEILKGYQFEKGDIFSGYINKMYELRLQYKKGDAMNLIAKLLMNSLYGKFGMNMETTEFSMYNTSTDEALERFKERIGILGESIKDFIKIDDYYIILRDTRLSLKYDEKDDMYHGQDINVAIASAITASARVHMSIFKNNPLFKLYYSDTDSAVIDKPLPTNVIGSLLGQLKLEHVITKAVFLAPKVYGLVDNEGNEIIKAKGLTKNNIKIADLEQLLNLDATKVFTQDKGFKSLFKSDITVLNTIYTLKTTSNKRQLIYKNGIFDNTKPYNYDEITSNKYIPLY
jgi:hypothetical protein